MKNKIIIFLIFFVGVRLGTLAQDSINIMPLIHEEDYNVDDYMRDVINVRKYFEKNEALGFLKNIPYNPEHDTLVQSFSLFCPRFFWQGIVFI